MRRSSFTEAALALSRSWLSPSGPERPPPADQGHNTNGDRPEENGVRR